MTNACVDIHADTLYSHTGYDVTTCFWSAFIAVQKTAKMPHLFAFSIMQCSIKPNVVS